jgi:hypothetical protein
MGQVAWDGPRATSARLGVCARNLISSASFVVVQSGIGIWKSHGMADLRLANAADQRFNPIISL